MAPLVSERARDCISSIAGAGVEFLEFHKVKSHATFVMNVLACEDVLDLQRSSLEVFMERYVFREDLQDSLPPIFKCPGLWGQIFVTSSFGAMLVENALRGVALKDPEERTMPLILKKARINRFPGLDG
jgi:hypothetical protein